MAKKKKKFFVNEEAAKKLAKEKMVSKVPNPSKLAGKFWSKRKSPSAPTRLQRAGSAAVKYGKGATKAALLTNPMTAIPTATTMAAKRYGPSVPEKGLVGAYNEMSSDVKQGVDTIKSGAEKIAYGKSGRPIVDTSNQDASLIRDEMAATKADMLAGPPKAVNKEAKSRRFFAGSSGEKDRRADFFRQGALRMGLGVADETAQELESRLPARIASERTTATKRGLESQLSGLKTDRRRGEDVVARQEDLGIINEGKLAEAMAGNIQSMNEIRGKIEAADVTSRNKAKADLAKPFLDPITGKFDQAGYMDTLDKLGLSEEAGVVAEADIDGDGQANAADQARIDIARRNLSKYDAMSPEDKAKHKNDPAVIESQAVIAKLKKNAAGRAAPIKV